MDEVEKQNESMMSNGTDNVLNALTEMILDEYLKEEQEEAALRGMTDEERQIEEERKKLTGFMSGKYGDGRVDQMSESFRALGEEMIAEKIHEILAKDVPTERKQKESQLQRSLKQSI